MAADEKRRSDALSQKEHEPAKGGTLSPRKQPEPSGDSPKPHGDPLKDDLVGSDRKAAR